MASSETMLQETEPYIQLQSLFEALRAFRRTFIEKATAKGICTMPNTLSWMFSRSLADGTVYGQMEVHWHGTGCECVFQKIYGKWDQIVCYPEYIVTLEEYEKMLFSFWSYANGGALDVLGGDKHCRMGWEIQQQHVSYLEKAACDVNKLLSPLVQIKSSKKYIEEVAKILRNGNPKWMPCTVQWTYIKELDELIKSFENIPKEEMISTVIEQETKETKTDQKAVTIQQRIFNQVKRIPHWIYYFVGFLAALLTIFHYVGWV